MSRATITRADILAQIKELVAVEGSQRLAADTLDVSVQYLNDILHGRRDFGPRVLNALGLEAVVTYRRKRS